MIYCFFIFTGIVFITLKCVEFWLVWREQVKARKHSLEQAEKRHAEILRDYRKNTRAVIDAAKVEQYAEEAAAIARCNRKPSITLYSRNGRVYGRVAR